SDPLGVSVERAVEHRRRDGPGFIHRQVRLDVHWLYGRYGDGRWWRGCRFRGDGVVVTRADKHKLFDVYQRDGDGNERERDAVRLDQQRARGNGRYHRG